jgi:hypothetical protein
MAPGELQVQRAIGQEQAARHRPRLRSGIQLGEASSRQPEGLVQLLWVGEEGHDQGVDHRQPTQPLLFVATQRLREHQVQMLKKCEDGLVLHHEAVCLGTSQSVDRALPTARLLQLCGRNAPVVVVLLGQAIRHCMTRAHPAVSVRPSLWRGLPLAAVADLADNQRRLSLLPEEEASNRLYAIADL